MILTKNHITALGGLLLLLLPLLLIPTLELRRRHVRGEMKDRLEQSTLHTLRLPASGLHWHKKGKEIRHEGRLFDVASLRYEGAEVVLTGLYDDEERRIEEFVHGLASEAGDTPLLHLLLLLQLAFTLPFLYFIPLPQRVIPARRLFLLCPIPAPMRAVPTPPPDGQIVG